MNKTSSAIVRTILLGTSCLSALGLIGAAQADPAGGVVVSGSATIGGKPNATIINQSTDRALINWQSFNIAAGGSVRFNQPGNKSITVNRVLGSQSSSIFGSLLANGQVWIINGNGILFGKSAQVNVGGLIATTADIADRDFENGNFSFSGGTGASVVNQGTIRTRNGGSAVLSGASVQNQGLIAADTGTVVLGGASAFTVDFTGDNLLRYAITAPAGKADNGQTGVSNSGSISAAGGHVILTARAAADIAGAVVNNTGMISATSARVANGEVVLDGGDGDVNVSGSINASGTGSGQTGGSVAITGRNITVADNTNINVSGDAGGGTVRIGGDLHGAGALQNADNVTVGAATIRADATRRGNGGTLVVWSNGLTDFSGIFSAKGGLMGGDGGFIETSGHTLNVGTGAKVDTTAPRGKTGTWLLDPDTIVIQAGEGTGTPIPPGGTLPVGTDSEDTDFVRPDTIIAALATTNVTLEASSEIDVYSPVIYSSSNALSLLSQGDINVYASIQNTQAVGGGAVNLVAGWDGVTAAGDILTTPGAYGGEGEVFLDSSDNDVFVGSASGATTIAAADVTLFAEDGGSVQIGYHGAGGGNIGVYATDNIALTAQNPGEGAHYAMIGNGALDGSVSGAITGDIFVSSLGAIDLATEKSAPGCDCDNIGQQSGGGPIGTGRTIGIGNESGIGEAPATGNVVMIAAEVNDDFDNSAGLGDIIVNQLTHGNMTLGHIGDESSINVDNFVDYDSPFALTLMSTSDIEVTGHLMNAGTGAITLIAGWDGVSDAAHLTDAGHYGLNGGSITIGGEDADADASIGSAHGALSLYGANLSIDPLNGYAQVGYHGAGGGDIFVNMTGDISAFGNGETNAYALLGNGSLDNDIEGNITGNISLTAGGQTVFANQEGQSWLGNVAGEGFSETGNLTALTRSGFFRADYIAADLGSVAGTGGNVFIGFTDAEVGDVFIGGFNYTSANDFTFAGSGGMNVTGTVSNAGSGAVTLVAGWDGHTVGTAAQLQTARAYGLGGAVMTVGSEGQFEDVSVGSASGRTTLLTGDLNVAPGEGFYAQVGYHGATGGDIFVVANGDLTLTAGATAHDYAMIGNGSLNGDVTGNITGNIDLRISGSTFLDSSAGEGVKAWIGNVAGNGFSETGNVLLQTFDLDTSDAISPMLASDLAGGDVTIAITDSEAQNDLENALIYNSAHNMTLLTAGSMTFLASVQNSGTGAVTVVAGWNGITFDPAHFGDSGVFGNNNGQVLIGGADASGNVAVGSAHGNTSVFANSVVVSGVHGYAQLGYHGIGGGAVAVTALNDVSVLGSGATNLAEIGNGGLEFGGVVGGAVSVKSGSLTVTASTAGSVAMVGNVGGANAALSGDVTINTHDGALALSASAANAHAHVGNWTSGNTAGTLSGNIMIDAGAVSLVTGGGPNAYSQIGNGTFRFALDTGAISGNMTIHAASFVAIANSGGQSRVGNLGAGVVSGDISLITTGNIVLSGSNGLVNIGDVSVGLDAGGNPANGPVSSAVLVQSGGVIALAAANNGNARIETGGSATGSMQVLADGDITLRTGTEGGEGTGSFAFIGTLLSGSGGMNIQVASTNGKVELDANEANSRVAIGNSQNGSIGGTLSGTVSVSAANTTNGNIVLSADGLDAMAQIGNLGDDGETVSGNVSLIAGNAITVGNGNVIFGDTNENPDDSDGTVPAPFTGNLLVSAKSLTGNLAPSFSNALSGGDVLVEIFGPSFMLGGPVAYNSGHVFSLLSAGDITVTGSIQNAGSGAINLVAGWDGTTTNAAHFADAGVFGNHGGAVLIGGADATGNAAVGSAGGQTNVSAQNLVLSGLHGYAQLGYHGAAGGTISVNALGVVSLIGTNAADYAMLGNGTVFGSNAAGGDVSVSSGSITAYGNSAATGANLKLAAASGGIGNAGPGGALRIAAGTLAVQTHGGSVYLTSPNGGVTFGTGGVQTMGGSFTLAAGGPITQTAALQTGALNLSTSSGAITLTDSGNSFGALTVATSGSDNATFSQASSITVAGAAVGGTLSLTGSAITQTGAIHAGALSVTGANGPITLTDSGNAFATLTVNDAGTSDVSIVDGSAVTLAGATTGGKLTLAAGGAIGQSGAIHAAALDVSTTAGAITLTNAANAFGALTVTTHGSDNASFAHSSLLTVASANVGGTLTLAAGTAVNQSGAIHAAALNVSAANGSIVLTNSGNAFGALTASTAGSNDATITDSTGVSVSGATIGGKLTLVSGGAVSQSGAIVANALDVSSTGGAIALTNSGNSFATLTVTTSGSNDASVTDATAVTLASVNVGGNFTLSAGGAVGQTGAITTHGLSVTASSITLTKATNAVSGTAQFTTPGAASFANSLATIVGASTVGGDFTLTSKGNVNFVGSVQSVSGNILVVAGWDGTTTDPSAFGNAGVYGNGGGDIVIGGTGAAGAVAVGSQHGSTTLYAADVTLSGDHGLAQLGYHGAGGGAIKVVALHNLQANASGFGAMIGNGSLAADVTGNVTGDIDVRLGGTATFSGAQSWLGNVAHAGSETGNLVFVATNAIGTFGSYVTSALAGGDVTLGFTGTTDQALAGTIAYNSSHSFSLLSAGNIAVLGTLQNAGTGAINLVAGWDGHTLTPSSFGTAGVYGNNGKGISIGGSSAAGNAAVGSAGGKTSVYGASLTLAAVHGYAQLGFIGHGAGAILVQTTGAVTLTGGGSANQFAQIGNGGHGTSGSNSGDIQITAGGDLTLTAGAGAEAYAQIGHGGAESNTGVSGGYSNTGAITVAAANVFLNAGNGAGAYSQIGHGGYKAGLNIAGGTANNGGDITITSAHAVTLTGNGADAYAQIGNGGSQSNQNAAAAAGGSDSGNIVVHAPNGAAGSVTLTAGAGANAYAQIGNGGYAVNAGPNATVASWTVTGDVSVTDLVLTGGNTGPNAYAVIGNGDASHNSIGNISGNITIDANGQITYNAGTAAHSPGTIGNFTGQGTVTGTLTGATPPSDVTTDPGAIGNIAVNTADNGSPTTNVPVIVTVVITDTEETGRPTVTAVALETSPPGPLALLDKGGADSSSPNTSDTATIVIADSLDGTKKGTASQFFMGGMLKQTIPGSAIHGVPPADQDFSSWGNEALWQ